MNTYVTLKKKHCTNWQNDDDSRQRTVSRYIFSIEKKDYKFYDTFIIIFLLNRVNLPIKKWSFQRTKILSIRIKKLIRRIL